MRFFVTALLIIGFFFALAGCGGGEALSQEEYQQRLDQTATDLAQRSAALGQELGGVLSGDASASEAAADGIGQTAEQFRESASELDDVDPPENAEEANDDLVSGLRAFADDLEEIQDSLGDGDLSDAQRRLGELEELDSIQTLEQAAEQLREAGYSFAT